MSDHFYGLKDGGARTRIEFVDGPYQGVHEVGYDQYGDLWPFLGDGEDSYALVSDDGRKYYKHLR